MPRRHFEDVSDFEAHVADAEELIFDGTENPVERPKGYEDQKAKYSGKQKAHTDIALVLSDKRKWIYYISALYDGCQVDMGLLKQEFPPEENWFGAQKMVFDLGFVGVGELYTINELVIGEKRPKKSKQNPKPELGQAQKEQNKQVSRERIFVEHAIGGMKVFRILKNKCRAKLQDMKDRIIGVCAGLWNHKIRLKY